CCFGINLSLIIQQCFIHVCKYMFYHLISSSFTYFIFISGLKYLRYFSSNGTSVINTSISFKLADLYGEELLVTNLYFWATKITFLDLSTTFLAIAASYESTTMTPSD